MEEDAHSATVRLDQSQGNASACMAWSNSGASRPRQLASPMPDIDVCPPKITVQAFALRSTAASIVVC